MTENINPENEFLIKIYPFEYYVKFSFWVSVFMIVMGVKQINATRKTGMQI